MHVLYMYTDTYILSCCIAWLIRIKCFDVMVNTKYQLYSLGEKQTNEVKKFPTDTDSRVLQYRFFFKRREKSNVFPSSSCERKVRSILLAITDGKKKKREREISRKFPLNAIN